MLGNPSLVGGVGAGVLPSLGLDPNDAFVCDSTNVSTACT